MDRYLPFISLILLIGCAGPRTIEPASRTVPPTIVQEEAVHIGSGNELSAPDLTLEHIALADSVLTQDFGSLLDDARTVSYTHLTLPTNREV